MEGAFEKWKEQEINVKLKRKRKEKFNFVLRFTLTI